MPTAKKVRVIPVAANFTTDGTAALKFAKLRVAAYARVSTIKQDESLEAQTDYYEKYINAKSEWEFSDIYADEAKSGTQTKTRDGFNRMIQDAVDGKIDLIISKSISRFARNTLDTLNYVRMLKNKGVGVYFETLNLNTLDNGGEVLLTILAAIAQDESRCISDNVKWGKRKRMADGKVFIPTKNFLGFKKDDDGNIIIDEREAKTVRLIYKLFLDGKTPIYIRKHLEEQKILSPGGKENWQTNTILSILRNEKYKGDALLQKCYVPDYLTKKVVKNDGILKQYYVEGSHPAIISPDVWDMTQVELRRRQENGVQSCGDNPLTGKIICGECGGLFGSKVWHSTSKYRRTIWRCNEKYKSKGAKNCDLPHFYEDKIKAAFVDAFNELYRDKDSVLATLQAVLSDVLTTKKYDEKIEDLTVEHERLCAEIKVMINRNAVTVQNQDEYEQQSGELLRRLKVTEDSLKEQTESQQARSARRHTAQMFIDALRNQPTALIEFDEGLWNLMIESVTVQVGSLEFRFKNGLGITKTI